MKYFPENIKRFLSQDYLREFPKYFTYEEAKAILYKFPTNTIMRYRQKFLCYFLWHTGTRITEARNIIISDIEPWAGVIHVQTSKRGNHIRTIPNPPEFFKELKAYMAINGINDRNMFLFPGRGNNKISLKTAWRWVNDTCRSAGIDGERSHPNTFRHSFAINCFLNKVQVSVIQKWLGHVDILDTMIYLKVLLRDKKINIDDVKI